MTATRHLDTRTETAVRAFMRHLENKYPLDGKYPILDVFVFGSRARGTHRPDSDLDLAVILGGERGDRYQTSGMMARVAFDVLLETDILVQALPLWEDELREPESFGNPALIHAIRRDGLRI